MDSEIVSLKNDLKRCIEQKRKHVEYEERSEKVSDQNRNVFMTPREWYKLETGFGDAYVRVPY